MNPISERWKKISTNGFGIAFSGWTVSNALYNTIGKTDAAKATIPLIFLFFFFYDIAYTPMLVAYTLEILPYKIRAKGFAVMVSQPCSFCLAHGC